MDEAQRFIRYVFPGMVASGLLLLHWVIADPTGTSLWLKDADLKVAELLGLVVAAGAFGYLLSVIHHQLYNSIYSLVGWIPDFRPTLANAVRDGRLILRVHQDGRALTGAEILHFSPRAAWVVLNGIWFDSLDSKLQPAEARSRSLFDIMHGSGTLFVGALVALACWLVTEIIKTTFVNTLTSYWWLCLGSTALVVFFLSNYVLATHLAEAFFAVMTATLMSRRETPLEVVLPRLPRLGRRVNPSRERVPDTIIPPR